MILAQRFNLLTLNLSHLNLSNSMSIGHSMNVAAHDAFKLSITAAFCAGSIMFFQPVYAENTGRIIKWKDEKGVTHYGDSIPPQYSNRENSLMNKQGITVQQNKNTDAQDTSSGQAQSEQSKKDKALLGTFSNAEEIDLTRDRNLEPELLVMKNLQQDRAVSLKKLEKIKAQTDAYSKAKKPIPADLKLELAARQEEVGKIDQKITARQKTIDDIRVRFDEDKKRYIDLRKKNTQAN